eukprot:s3492_g11.t1
MSYVLPQGFQWRQAILADRSAAKTKAYSSCLAPQRPQTAEFPAIGVMDADAAQVVDGMVNLGELKKKPGMHLTDVERLLQQIERERRSIKRDPPEDAKRTLEYCKKFKQLQNSAGAGEAKGQLLRLINVEGKYVRRCRDFEATQLLNLMPVTADEARTLIPTLEGNRHLEDLVKELKPLKEFDPHVD